MARIIGNLIILDFDGVIADSEVLANEVLAEAMTGLGVPTTLQDAYRLFMGKRFAEVMATVEASLGQALPEDFAERLQARTLARFRQELRPVNGAVEYIRAFSDVPRCIASSSLPDRLALCLELLGIEDEFGPHVYSASMVARGKPHPDIFLHAAERMGAAPADTIVVEDSPSGVQAALAAGMTVIGLLAASHIQTGHDEVLRAAGAQHLASSFADAEEITRGLLEP